MNKRIFANIIDELENIKFLSGFNVPITNAKLNFTKQYIEQLEDKIHRLNETQIKDLIANYPKHLPEISKFEKLKSTSFDYITWRKKTRKSPISFKYYPVVQIYPSASSIIKTSLKIDLFTAKILDFLELSGFDSRELKNNIINVDINDFYCLEFPVSKESLIIAGKQNSDFLTLIYFTHEIGHYLFNKYKFKYDLNTNIETDEYFAHFFELWLLKSLLPNKHFGIYINILSNLLNENLLYTEYQTRIYQKPLEYQLIKSREALFGDLERKYKKNHIIDCFKEMTYHPPFFHGIYINAQLNSLKMSSIPIKIIKKRINVELQIMKENYINTFN